MSVGTSSASWVRMGWRFAVASMLARERRSCFQSSGLSVGIVGCSMFEKLVGVEERVWDGEAPEVTFA